MNLVLSAPAQDFNMVLFLPSRHAFPVMANMPMACRQRCSFAAQAQYTQHHFWLGRASMLFGLQNYIYFHVLLAVVFASACEGAANIVCLSSANGQKQ